jgi:predicted amidohydrolase
VAVIEETVTPEVVKEDFVTVAALVEEAVDPNTIEAVLPEAWASSPCGASAMAKTANAKAPDERMMIGFLLLI